jgi:probable phosphoglycerate mutase
VPLNPFGRVQAQEAGERLRRSVPAFAGLHYVSSPLARARDTMEGVRGVLGLPPSGYGIDDRLKELSFGAWEGLTWKEVRARDPQAAAARERDKWNYVPPGGESYAMLAERVAPALDDLTRETVIVSHGGVARVLLALLCAVPHDEAPVTDIWQGRVLVIAEGRHRWM